MKQAVSLALFLFWTSAVGFGIPRMWRYESLPAPASATRPDWPTETALPPPRDGEATLLVFTHPRCPCSRATLTELERLSTRLPRRIRIYVLFCKPSDTPARWERGALYDQAAALQGIRILTDAGGKEARRFHASVSGQTLLFDADGRLLFNGGITVARGHIGDNGGEMALLAALQGRARQQQRSPIFGCSLY